LVATALIIKDIVNLPGANSEERERIFDLRETPNQEAIEKGPKGEMNIIYHTKL